MTLNTFNKQIIGTIERPRVSVFRSNRFISAQLIDDISHKTICSITTKKLAQKVKPVEKAKLAGIELAKIAKAKKITKVVYDRNGYRYHGQIEALATGLREGGLEF